MNNYFSRNTEEAKHRTKGIIALSTPTPFFRKTATVLHITEIKTRENIFFNVAYPFY